MSTSPVVAYFTMEIALRSSLPTYAGGLGVLAGDTASSAADMGMPFVVVTLLARKGYFHQRIDADGWQHEEPVSWPVSEHLEEMSARVHVTLGGRSVALRAWRYQIPGATGQTVPVYFLDADLEDNAEADRRLTDYLYGGDAEYRLCQEALLGMGGVRMLHALGYSEVRRYHMNEGHAALLVLELVEQQARHLGESPIRQAHLDAVKPRCVFTTHTPVPAGHDQFPRDLVHRVLGDVPALTDLDDQLSYSGTLNMTYLAFAGSHYVNGVGKRHRDVSQQMFAPYKVDSISNGVHVATWAARPFQSLFDHYIPDWRQDNPSLRSAMGIPGDEIWGAHRLCKRELLDYVTDITGERLDPNVLTIGFARRATQYKRPDLLFTDTERLKDIAHRGGPIQLVFAGKAHPRDGKGKELIQFVHRMRDTLNHAIHTVYLPDYDTRAAQLLVAGCDVWLNTPQPPLEASGTSGMKAAINGVPSLSVLDGWWLEGCIEGVTGWAIGSDAGTGRGNHTSGHDADSLYHKLEHWVLPQYYHHRPDFIEVMRQAIALNGSFFNTERMLSQYIARAYYK